MNNQKLSGAVHVWHIHALAEHPGLDGILSSEEVARSSRFYDPLHAINWRYFHCALRVVLSRYTGCGPQGLQFAELDHKKPILRECPGLFFNLSHSADRALLAITQTAPVGVDIEFQRTLKDRQALINRNFSNTEQNSLAKLSGKELSTAFYRVWTRKEAVIKAHGIGLSLALKKFDVPVSAMPAWRPTVIRQANIGRARFQIQEVSSADGFIGALALQVSPTKAVSDLPVEHIEYRGN